MLSILDSLKNQLDTGRQMPGNWKTRREKALQLLETFAQWTGAAPGQEICLGFVPGRIEVLGRHTDYAGGRTIVCSIDRGFLFAAAPGAGRRVRLREDSSEFSPVEFELDPSLLPAVGEWANYPMTMARRIARNFPGALRGVDIAFSSTMPVGSGMSGSSALMMMVFTAIAVTNRLHDHPAFREHITNPVELSVYLACAENGKTFRGLEGDTGVGTFGGSEDHAAILTARPSCLSVFGFSPPELQAEMTWPARWGMAVAFSGVRAEKTREALEKYNMASLRVSDAVARFNERARTRLSTLREVVDHEPKPGGRRWLQGLEDPAFSWSTPAAPALADRVRQFILEDRTHIPGAVSALRAENLPAFGRLVSASHRASKRYLWNIVPEIDSLQRSACRLGAAGASGFGAGFGGSIFAVTRADRADELLAAWRTQYRARYPDRAAESAFFIAHPGPGIETWSDSGPVRLADQIFQA